MVFSSAAIWSSEDLEGEYHFFKVAPRASPPHKPPIPTTLDRENSANLGNFGRLGNPKNLKKHTGYVVEKKVDMADFWEFCIGMLLPYIYRQFEGVLYLGYALDMH